LISSQLELHTLSTGRQARVETAETMLKQMLFRYQGNVSAALILGGVDFKGHHLCTIYPHGSTDSLPYVTMGSGSLAAMAVFEAYYKLNMTKENGIKLVQAAVNAGVLNDLGSGGNIDVTVITKDGVERIRNPLPVPRKYTREKGYQLPPGSTPILEQSVYVVEDGSEAMEL